MISLQTVIQPWQLCINSLTYKHNKQRLHNGNSWQNPCLLWRAELASAGQPLSVCLRLQQLRLPMSAAQWSTRQTNSGFSVSFFWPSQRRSSARGATATSQKKPRNRRPRNKNRGSPATSTVPAQVVSSAQSAHSPCCAAIPIDALRLILLAYSIQHQLQFLLIHPSCLMLQILLLHLMLSLTAVAITVSSLDEPASPGDGPG